MLSSEKKRQNKNGTVEEEDSLARKLTALRRRRERPVLAKELAYALQSLFVPSRYSMYMATGTAYIWLSHGGKGPAREDGYIQYLGH